MVAEIDRLRKANESLGGVFEVRAFGLVPGARLARLLGGAARRAARPGAALDPGDQGGGDRGWVRGRGAAGLPGPRRDLPRRGARLLPRDQPRRRGRGRDDDRRAAGRPRLDEAAADADQAAAVGRHRDPRAGRGAARADRLLHGAGGRASSGRRWWRSCSPTRYRRKFGGDHIDDVRAALRPTRSGSGGREPDAPALRPGRALDRLHRLHGGWKDDRRASAAEALGTASVDVDGAIEERLGKSIERVFAEDGEAAFRAVEEQVTLELLDRRDAPVLALGGGAIGSDAVRDALREHLVVWIDIDLEAAWARSQGSGRPLARDRGEFERLYAAREPIYASLADVTVPARRSQEMPPCSRRSRGCRRGRRCCGRPATPATIRPTSAPGCWARTASGRRRSTGAGSSSATATSRGCTATGSSRSAGA